MRCCWSGVSQIFTFTLLIVCEDSTSNENALSVRVSATPAKTENEVEGRLLLDIVVQESVTILQLFPDGNQTLLVRGWFSIMSEQLNLQRDCLANEEGLCNPRKDRE